MSALGPRVYKNSYSVYIVNFSNIFYFAYFGFRMQYMGILIPDFDDDDQIIDNRIYFPFANIILIATSFAMFMVLARVNEKFGQLIQLVFRTFVSIKYFVFFFIIWIISFGLMFQIIGAKISN